MDSAKQPTSKGSKNTVNVRVNNDRLSLRLPREVSRAAYGKEQYIVSLGLADTPKNRKIAQRKADLMSDDIAYGCFDVTLEKYELGVVAANKLTAIDGGKKPELGILELWEKFKEYKRPSLAETTFIITWERNFTKRLKKAVEQTDGTPIAIRNYVIENYNILDCKNLLATLEAAYKWGVKHELISKNLFLGMSEEITVKRKIKGDDSFDELEDIRAFSLDEMYAIIEAYKSNKDMNHWTNLVTFLFYTGCRPGEAVALRWKHISPDCKVIRFSQSYCHVTNTTKSTKTDTTRIFPCHRNLTALLLEIKPSDLNPESLVFLSKTGKQITWSIFARTWRGASSSRVKSVIERLVEENKIRQYLKPYATRHTFITAQVDAGIDAHVIAAWVGNSADIIWQHYYQHKKDVKPADI